MIKHIINNCLEAVCTALFVFITIIGTYQIVTRYVFNSPSTVSEELLTYAFTWLALLSAALVFGKRDHMRMSFFADKFKGKTAYCLKIVAEVLTIIFAFAVLIYGGTAITKLTATQITASLGVPMSYIYAVLPVSGVITLIYGILNLYEISKER